MALDALTFKVKDKIQKSRLSGTLELAEAPTDLQRW